MPLSNQARDYCGALWGDRLRELIGRRDFESEQRAGGLTNRADINVRVGFLNYAEPKVKHIARLGLGRMECLVKAYSWDGQPLSEPVLEEMLSDIHSHMKFAAEMLLRQEKNELDMSVPQDRAAFRTSVHDLEKLQQAIEVIQKETTEEIERKLKIQMYEGTKQDSTELGSADGAQSLARPDLDWCSEISQRKSIPTRCPFASVDLCPRYFLTVDRLGVAQIATKLSREEDSRLEAKWKHHPLWPRTAEQSPAIVGSRGKAEIFTHFCPEVAFDTFGLFADSLAEYTSELDRDLAHESLGRSRVGQYDWRWQWSNVNAMHYSDCPLYSPLRQHGTVDHEEGKIEPSKNRLIKECASVGSILAFLGLGIGAIQLNEYGVAVILFFVTSALIPVYSSTFRSTSFWTRARTHRRSLQLISWAAALFLFAVLGTWTWHRKGTQPWFSSSVQPKPAAAEQTNQVQQRSTGEGSPNVQGVQGEVTITVDQSKGKTEVQKPPEKKPKPEDK
jgi:hypothetical protein